MAGVNIKGDGVSLYMIVVKEDESPKLVEAALSVSGGSTMGTNAVNLPNRSTYIRTDRQEVIDLIAEMGAVLDNGVEIPD